MKAIHPATFPCSLCPKRFTRAFNLRNHFRTHTDERPFVCTVCGKAFNRKNDHKSHEQLHSGEKKWICKGDLDNGCNWGCGRRFARSSNLGRHFRSECGQICIKPLLEEEHAKRLANPAWPLTPRANAEPTAATTLTDIARTSETGRSSAYIESTTPPARPDVSQAALSVFSSGDLAAIHWNAFDQPFLIRPPLETQNASNIQRAKPGSVLEPRENIQLLEKIFRDKGFDVEAEINSEIRKAGILAYRA
ncbi:hypothetical protein BKA61DRAFT_216462 [Leptodontidium sp. MPI-SDFR-AT-0119]|nr:hypothetical protein BKA61DRAFT_216462 [Leptodontidium sp. MPI-SDFR-AT-0119]